MTMNFSELPAGNLVLPVTLIAKSLLLKTGQILLFDKVCAKILLVRKSKIDILKTGAPEQSSDLLGLRKLKEMVIEVKVICIVKAERGSFAKRYLVFMVILVVVYTKLLMVRLTVLGIAICCQISLYSSGNSIINPRLDLFAIDRLAL